MKDFKWVKIWSTGLFSEKTEALHAESNERAEAAANIFSATVDYLQYISSVLMTKNHEKIRSRCLVHEFSLADLFNDINHGYRAAILKKSSLWLLPFYMAVATHNHYDKVRKRCALQLYRTSLTELIEDGAIVFVFVVVVVVVYRLDFIFQSTKYVLIFLQNIT